MANIQSVKSASGIPAGSLYLNTQQSDLVNGAETKVELDTITSGFTDTIEDIVNSKITPAVAGLYMVIGGLTFFNQIVDKDYELLIYVSGSLRARNFGHVILVSSIFPVYIAKPLWLTKTDYVELFALSDAGENTVDIYPGKYNTFLELYRVR